MRERLPLEDKLLKTNNLKLWRRRESNPRPKSLSARRIHAQSSSEGFASDAQNGQDAPEASPMISRLRHGPSRNHTACCATPALSPQAKPRRTAA
jgi:hypothetical protein